MKLTREEMIQKYTDKISENDDLKMELLEDISDSMIDSVISQEEFEQVSDDLATATAKYEELKEKYIRRFSEGSEDPEDEEEEKEVIDIKEI